MFRFLSIVLDGLLEILFCPSCIICKRLTLKVGVCSECNLFIEICGVLCERCGDWLGTSETPCVSCIKRDEIYLDKIRSALWLTDEAKFLIHEIKFKNHFEWFRIFEKYLMNLNFPFDLSNSTLVPVPIHVRRFMKRGFNQSEMIIEQLNRNRKIRISFGLRKKRNTEPQSQLNRENRLLNLKGSFVWRSHQEVPKRIILIDDILTTGETLNECARVLKRAGAEEVYGWTLFRTKNIKNP